MDNRKLPIGIQSFEEIRNKNYIYIDKTEYIWNLVEKAGKSFFLFRPRRFGKSLFITTLESYFRGRKEIFRGLWIEERENARGKEAWLEYPVISFYLSGGDYNAQDGLKRTLQRVLKETADRYGCSLLDSDLPNQFADLIQKLEKKTGRQVVVLADEYDKPLLSTMLNNSQQERKNRDLYKGFFSVLKDQDQYLKFVFFTGVTKFSKVSIFSDLNQLDDISLWNEYSGICGISEEEMINNFEPEIAELAKARKIAKDTCLERLRSMYDGYHFSENAEGMYNPFSLLNAFQKKKFGKYWFETGTPTFLIRKLRSSHFLPEQFSDGVTARESDLKDYRADDPNPIPLFYQSGYLTICDYDEDFELYTLRFPNDEVKFGFLNSLTKSVLGESDTENPLALKHMVLDLRMGKIDSFMNRLTALFAGIPYSEGQKLDYEREWRSQIYLILMLLGQNVKCEVHSAKGRADCIVETKDYVYVFEFKVNKTAEDALRQIETKGYATPYQADTRKIIKIGVNFSSALRNITEWKSVLEG